MRDRNDWVLDRPGLWLKGVAMSGAFLIIGTVLLIAGIAVNTHALLKYRHPHTPRPVSLNPRDWRPVWKTRDWFVDARGYRLYIASIAVWILALALLLLFFLS